MILETAQLLSTAVQKVKPITGLYKVTHFNHPCTIWTSASRQNFNWLAELGLALSLEYTFRYKKTHKSTDVILEASQYYKLFPDLGMTPFAQAMPEQYKSADAVEAYRNYYKTEKASISKWTKRDAPEWFTNGS